MTNKAQEAFGKVEEFRKSNPNERLQAVFKKLKVDPASYYRGRKNSLGIKDKPVKRKNAQIAASKKKEGFVNPQPTKGSAVVLLIGSPEQIGLVMRNYL